MLKTLNKMLKKAIKEHLKKPRHTVFMVRKTQQSKNINFSQVNI